MGYLLRQFQCTNPTPRNWSVGALLVQIQPNPDNMGALNNVPTMEMIVDIVISMNDG